MNQVFNTVMIPVEEYEALRRKVEELQIDSEMWRLCREQLAAANTKVEELEQRNLSLEIFAPQIDRLEDVEKELAAMTHCYNIECANHKSSREQLDAMTDERDSYKAMVKEQWAQPELAASKAREQQLRIAMFNTASACRIWGGEAERARKMLEDYLALPQDDAALDARLASERERCAKVCGEIGKDIVCPEECAAAIRSLT